MRTIKRYSNRKLYDTREKRYLTLKHLSRMVGDGEKIQVVDNDTGKDITGVVLSKALTGKEKDSAGGFLPAELLSNLLQGRPHQLLDYLQSSWETGLEQLKEFEGEIDKRVQGLKGKLSAKEAKALRDSLLSGFRSRWKALENSLEGRLEAALESMPVASRRDIDRIEAQIEDLGDRLEAISKGGSSRKAAAKPKRKATKKKAAKKAPAKRKATKRKPAKKAAKKAPARRKPAKKAAKKAPAKRKPAKKAPAKRKPAKKAARKAPAKRKPAKKAAKKRTTTRRKR